MNLSKICIIIFCVFLGSSAPSSNKLFLDSIVIPGAKCKISVPIDTFVFASIQHPCNNYAFFKAGRSPCHSQIRIYLDFSSTVKCSLFVRSTPFGNLEIFPHPDTLPFSCDSLKYYQYLNFKTLFSSAKDSLYWNYACLVHATLANTNHFPLNSFGVHFVLKSASDSSEVYLSRTILHFTQINYSLCKKQNTTNSVGKFFTLNGALIQSNRTLPLVYIKKDNTTAKPMIHLNKF